MTVAVLLLFIVISLRAAWKRSAWTMVTLSFTLIWVMFVGTGALAFLLLSSLQKQSESLRPDWGAHNLIIVLGGGTVKWNGQVRTLTLASPRLSETVRLYLDCRRQPNRSCQILASGGDPMANGVSEADTIARELSELGVDATAILRETESRNTFENARDCARLLKATPLPTDAKLFLVTSGVHMRRAATYFRFFHLPVAAAPADYLAVPVSIFPNSINFILADAGLHEALDFVRFKGERLLRDE